VTIREALREAIHRLELQRIPNPRLCAEVLVAHALSAERTYLYTHDEKAITDEQYQILENGIYERASGVPVQYIVGRQEFYGRDFLVNPAVLIPRPETEYVVEAVLETNPPAGSRIIDVGTGSGCIAITLALEIPGSQVFAADISEYALRVALENAARLQARVRFVNMDLLEAVFGEFEFVVSNPPYVRAGDLASLQREVREHEPHVALFSSGDETDIYRRLIASAAQRLKRGGRLIMEIGIGMEERVLGLLDQQWQRHPTKADLQGIPRTVIAERL
jgi:release factor glutamine methyltransferase